MIHHLYLQILFRPFLNALVLIYDFMPIYQDMGIALIIFVIILRIILFPLRFKSKASEPDQEKTMEEINAVEEQYKYEPVKLKQAKKEITKKYRGVLNLRAIDLTIQAIYFAMLWRIFGQGFTPDELALLYPFVRHPHDPMNLTFLHLFDLTKPNPALNAISAIGLFILLFYINWTKPQKASREDYILMFWSPVAAFFITYRIPAGQEFFFTVTETIEFFLAVNDRFKSWRKKVGLSETLIGRETFFKIAKDQVLGG